MTSDKQRQLLVALRVVEEAVRKGQSVTKTFAKAAKLSGLSAFYVRKGWYRAHPRAVGEHGLKLLSPQQERQLVCLIAGFSMANVPLDITFCRRVVQLAYRFDVSESWMYKFVGRHDSKLHIRKPKLLASKRTGSDLHDEVIQFLDVLEENLGLHNFRPHNVINYDETRCTVGSFPASVVEAATKKRSNTLGVKPASAASLITFIAADGSVVMSVYILKGKPSKEGDRLTAYLPILQQEVHQRRVWPRFFAISESGYMNSALFESVMNKFGDVWLNLHPGLEVFVFGDQLGSHINAKLTEDLLQKGVLSWLLPSNASHFLQPLDSYPFAIFKRKLKVLSSRVSFLSRFTSADLTHLLFAAMYEAERLSFTKGAIIRAFQDTGLYPLNRDVIRANSAANNLGLLDQASGPVFDPMEQAAVDTVAKVVVAGIRQDGDSLASTVVGQTVSASRAKVHSPDQLVDRANAVAGLAQEKAAKRKEREEAVEANKRQKLERQISIHCLFESCPRWFNGGKKWLLCSKCNVVRGCRDHYEVLIEHENICSL